jgi:hypothetical protein
MATPHEITANTILFIKLGAIGTAITFTAILAYGLGFNGYLAIVLGIGGYVLAKTAIGIAVGYRWGRHDALERKEYLAILPEQVKQDIIDHAPRASRAVGEKKLLPKED